MIDVMSKACKKRKKHFFLTIKGIKYLIGFETVIKKLNYSEILHAQGKKRGKSYDTILCYIQ
jgi:hypothetical protein